MTREIRKTFEVAVPTARAWRAFTDAEECAKWQAGEYEIDPVAGGALRYTIADLVTVDGRVEAAEPERLLRYSEGPGLLPGTTVVTVTFESLEAGTRITITHAGFGDGPEWNDDYESHGLGWSQAIADLVAYLEAGVVAQRFVTPMLDTGMATRETDAGLRVKSVRPGSFADQAGLQTGDLVLGIGGVPIYRRSDLWCVTRDHLGGLEREVVFARAGERRTGRGTMPSGDHLGGA